MTKDLVQDPAEHAVQNQERRLRAARIIEHYRIEVIGDDEDALADLLCDLQHHAVAAGLDFDAELERARGHFRVESGIEC